LESFLPANAPETEPSKSLTAMRSPQALQLPVNLRAPVSLGTFVLSSRNHQLDQKLDFETARQTEFPEGGYGWACVACMLTFIAMTWGVNGGEATLAQLVP
jgi:hypothetical protein